MPIIIEKKNLKDVNPEVLKDRRWFYYQCAHCQNEVKSDIGFSNLSCIYCGGTMNRIDEDHTPW
jgi:hypothetical protein